MQRLTPLKIMKTSLNAKRPVLAYRISNWLKSCSDSMFRNLQENRQGLNLLFRIAYFVSAFHSRKSKPKAGNSEEN